jgi:hypothetical protein
MTMLALLVVGVGLWTSSALGQTRFPTHVACVGDSITAGDHASSPLTTYPADLQQFLGAATVVRNFGVVGTDLLSTGDIPYVAKTAFADATAFVSNEDVGAVVDVLIMLGTNDSKPSNWAPADGGTSATQFAADCGAMVDHFTSLPTHPVVYWCFRRPLTPVRGASATVSFRNRSSPSSIAWPHRRGSLQLRARWRDGR